MTNEEWLKSMDANTLARFLNFKMINCEDACNDFSEGCFWTCKHKDGIEIIEKWLKTKREESKPE